MTETGATDEQIEAAVNQWMAIAQRTEPRRTFTEHDRFEILMSVQNHARFLVPPGYKIVTVDAVCVSPEIAATAEETCEKRANGLEDGLRESGWTNGSELTVKIRRNIQSYREAAAALRGDGDG